jgi:hypothetical protein
VNRGSHLKCFKNTACCSEPSRQIIATQTDTGKTPKKTQQAQDLPGIHHKRAIPIADLDVVTSLVAF